MDEKVNTFGNFIAGQATHISPSEFIVNMLLAILLANIARYLYTHYGTSLNNRRIFSKNFILLTMVTMLIITIVKSSLALSLGLVGALSIVRFRAAIKEPEELIFLFLSIAIGLGLGANQRVITIVGFFMICSIIIFKPLRKEKSFDQSPSFTVYCKKPNIFGLKELTDIVKKYCSEVMLKRFDESSEELNATFIVGCKSFDDVLKMKKDIQNENDNVQITLIDTTGTL